MNNSGPGPAPDHATRFMAASVHLDDQFADLLIEEFLSEPYRAIPPSPGVRAEVVLREAVAARARRRRINAILLGLLTLMTLCAFPLIFGWLLSGGIWRLCAAIVTGVGRSAALARFGLQLTGGRQLWWATAVLWSAIPVVWISILGPLVFMFHGLSNSTAGGLFLLAIFIVLVIGSYATLIARTYLPWTTVNDSYSFAAYNPATPMRAEVARSCAPYVDRLCRIANDDSRRLADRSDEVIVYRGGRPFLGAGTRVRAFSMAFELRPKNGSPDANLPQLLPSDLQKYVADDLHKLRAAPNLTPGWRFSDLEITRWALLSAMDMPFASGAEDLMSQLHAGLDPQLSEQAWQQLADGSPEWLRFYRCFRLESWARQLAISGYLHVGCEERMLVVDWHAFVLPPVDPAFREVDLPPRMLELHSMWRAIADLALLPTTVPSMVADIGRGIRERLRSKDVRWNSPAQAAEIYGAAVSVRELGSGNTLNHLFQETDCDRYLKILERRVLDAIGRYLDKNGVTAKGFDEVVTQIFNSTILNNSNVIAGNIGGQDNRGRVETGGSNSGSNPGAGGAQQ